jgi:hypothetical protein
LSKAIPSHSSIGNDISAVDVTALTQHESSSFSLPIHSIQRNIDSERGKLFQDWPHSLISRKEVIPSPVKNHYDQLPILIDFQSLPEMLNKRREIGDTLERQGNRLDSLSLSQAESEVLSSEETTHLIQAQVNSAQIGSGELSIKNQDLGSNQLRKSSIMPDNYQQKTDRDDHYNISHKDKNIFSPLTVDSLNAETHPIQNIDIVKQSSSQINREDLLQKKPDEPVKK